MDETTKRVLLLVAVGALCAWILYKLFALNAAINSVDGPGVNTPPADESASDEVHR